MEPPHPATVTMRDKTDLVIGGSSYIPIIPLVQVGVSMVHLRFRCFKVWGAELMAPGVGA